MENIFQHQKSIQDNIQKSFVQDEEYIIKGVEGDIIVYDQLFQFEDIKRYTNDVNKAFTAGEISQDELEKAKKDLSRLAMRQVFDKNGHKRIVYVKIHEDEHGTTHETDFDKDDVVKFTKDGKEMSGKIKSMKYHDKTDKVGTAMVEVDGKVYSVSMSKLSHEDDDFKKPNPLKVGSTPEIEAVKKRTEKMKEEDKGDEGVAEHEEPKKEQHKFVLSAEGLTKEQITAAKKQYNDVLNDLTDKLNASPSGFAGLVDFSKMSDSEAKAHRENDAQYNKIHKQFRNFNGSIPKKIANEMALEARQAKIKYKTKEEFEAVNKQSSENISPKVKSERKSEALIEPLRNKKKIGIGDNEDDGGLLSEVNEKLLEAENQLKSAKERGRFATSTQHRLVSDLNLLRLGFDSKTNVGKIARNVGTKGYYYHPSAVELAKKRYEELTQNKNSSKQVEKKKNLAEEKVKREEYDNSGIRTNTQEQYHPIGTKVTVQGRDGSGTIVKLPTNSTEQYSVDFGNGNVYGIMPNRISPLKGDVKNKLPAGVLGLTKSGKKVYENNKKGDHKVYSDFTIQDHEDAKKIHNDKADEWQKEWDRQSEQTRRTSGTKGYRIHPIDTKRNTHTQRAIEHGFEITRLKEEQNKVNKSIDKNDIEKAFNTLGTF